MADGWNARHRGKNWGLDKKNRGLPDRVRWHEIRSAVIFRLSALMAVSGKRKALMEKHVVAVPADTSPYDFGALLHREAVRMGLPRAKAVFFVMDDGVWLWNIYRDHFENHAEHMDYAANAGLGIPVGSGSVESLCSQFQNRLKRTGQFWTREGFTALLRIVVRYWNGELDSLWLASAT